MKKSLLLLCIILCSCVSPKTHYPDIDQAELEQERLKQQDFVNRQTIKEKKKKNLRKIEHQQRLVKVSSKILEGGIGLCSSFAQSKNGCVYDFELSDDKSVNAYADGKKIYVSQAMMNFAETDEELAIVLGHEYAHNVLGHVSAKKQNMLFGNLLGVALDVAVGTGSTFSNLGASIGATQYSQEFEKEADYAGLYITYLSGYDISKAPEFWRKMSLRNEKAINNAVTHPTNPERYIGLDKTIREIRTKEKNGEAILPSLRITE